VQAMLPKILTFWTVNLDVLYNYFDGLTKLFADLYLYLNY